MILWLVIAAAILLVSLVVALRSMKAVSEAEEAYAVTQLPPQPRVKHHYDKAIKQKSSATSATAVGSDEPEVALVTPQPAQSEGQQQKALDESVPTGEPRNVAEALEKLHQAQERAKVQQLLEHQNFETHLPPQQAKEAEAPHKIERPDIRQVSQQTLGRFIGSIPIANPQRGGAY